MFHFWLIYYILGFGMDDEGDVYDSWLFDA